MQENDIGKPSAHVTFGLAHDAFSGHRLRSACIHGVSEGDRGGGGGEGGKGEIDRQQEISRWGESRKNGESDRGKHGRGF